MGGPTDLDVDRLGDRIFVLSSGYIGCQTDPTSLVRVWLRPLPGGIRWGVFGGQGANLQKKTTENRRDKINGDPKKIWG